MPPPSIDDVIDDAAANKLLAGLAPGARPSAAGYSRLLAPQERGGGGGGAPDFAVMRRVLAHARHHGVAPDAVLLAAYLEAALRCPGGAASGLALAALAEFRALPPAEHNSRTFSPMIEVMGRAGRAEWAHALFREAQVTLRSWPCARVSAAARAACPGDEELLRAVEATGARHCRLAVQRRRLEVVSTPPARAPATPLDVWGRALRKGTRATSPAGTPPLSPQWDGQPAAVAPAFCELGGKRIDRWSEVRSGTPTSATKSDRSMTSPTSAPCGERSFYSDRWADTREEPDARWIRGTPTSATKGDRLTVLPSATGFGSWVSRQEEPAPHWMRARQSLECA